MSEFDFFEQQSAMPESLLLGDAPIKPFVLPDFSSFEELQADSLESRVQELTRILEEKTNEAEKLKQEQQDILNKLKETPKGDFSNMYFAMVWCFVVFP